MAYYAHIRNGIIEGVGTCFAVAIDTKDEIAKIEIGHSFPRVEIINPVW